MKGFRPCPVCSSDPFVRKELQLGIASCNKCELVKVIQTQDDTRPLDQIWNEKVVEVAYALSKYGWSRNDPQTTIDSRDGRVKVWSEPVGDVSE